MKKIFAKIIVQPIIKKKKSAKFTDGKKFRAEGICIWADTNMASPILEALGNGSLDSGDS